MRVLKTTMYPILKLGALTSLMFCMLTIAPAQVMLTLPTAEASAQQYIFSLPDCLVVSEATASEYRRSPRRSSRRSVRRSTIYTNNTILVGTEVVSTGSTGGSAVITPDKLRDKLPASCVPIMKNGITIQKCNGTDYRPHGTQWIAVPAM